VQIVLDEETNAGFLLAIPVGEHEPAAGAVQLLQLPVQVDHRELDGVVTAVILGLHHLHGKSLDFDLLRKVRQVLRFYDHEETVGSCIHTSSRISCVDELVLVDGVEGDIEVQLPVGVHRLYP